MVKTAAIGAVIDEVNPAENNPIPKSRLAQGPNFSINTSDNFSKLNGRSTIDPTNRIAIDIIPPKEIARIKPIVAVDRARPLLSPDPRNKLYGTMVVPTSPITRISDPDGKVGITVL